MKLRLSIGTQLAVGFGLLLLLMVLSSIIVYVSMGKMKTLNSQLSSQQYPLIVAGYELDSSLDHALASMRGAVLSNGSAQFHAEFSSAWQEAASSEGRLNHMRGELGNSQDEQRLEAIDKDVWNLRTVEKAALAANAKARGPYLNQAEQLQEEITQNLHPLLHSQQDQAKQASEDVRSATSWTNGTILLSTLLAVLLGAVIAAFVGRRMANAVQALLARARAIAEGDLTGKEMVASNDDELGELTSAINLMQENLRNMIESVANTTERVASASEEMSTTANQQAQGAETQRDQAQQVATALQEMAATVLQVSEHSNRASDAAREAADTARQGGMIVEQTLERMRAIAETVGTTAARVEDLGRSSDQIGEIIGVIDDIADQTNLLALNAAIEAARAGEQGRGFAVVADEVRKLAERTSKATKEIAQMIKGIQSETQSAVSAMQIGTQQVDQGVATTAQAGEALNEIIRMAEQVGDMVMHIATAATEQSSATDEVNLNIEQISRITQEAAAGAQQSAKACHELSTLALDLQNMVSRFKLSQLNYGNNLPAETSTYAAYAGE